MASLSPTARVAAHPTEISVPSRSLGHLTVSAEDVIDFVAPVSGFPDCRRYALVPHTLPDGSDRASVAWLQSLDTPFHAFVVTDPWMILPDYAPEIPDADAAELGITSFQDARLFAILTLPGDPREISINLRAPIVVNATLRRAKQIVLLGDEYSPRHAVSPV